MKKIPNLQFTSPEADRKVMLVISIVMMILFWIFLAAILALLLKQIPYLSALQYTIAGFLFIMAFLLIPFQLVRYVQELRKLRASKSDI